MPLDDVLMHPAADGARPGLGLDASRTQRTGVTDGFAAHVADFEPPAIVLECCGSLQQLAARTTIRIDLPIIGKLFMAQAPPRREPDAAPDLRNIGNDAVILAILQLRPV